jgi:hypothetical protein
MGTVAIFDVVGSPLTFDAHLLRSLALKGRLRRFVVRDILLRQRTECGMLGA